MIRVSRILQTRDGSGPKQKSPYDPKLKFGGVSCINNFLLIKSKHTVARGFTPLPCLMWPAHLSLSCLNGFFPLLGKGFSSFVASSGVKGSLCPSTVEGPCSWRRSTLAIKSGNQRR